MHALDKAEIMRFALAKRAAGEYYDLRLAELEDIFRGSIDRFCDIALAFRDARRVLDAGSGNGLLLALLKLLGHEVCGVDIRDHRSGDLYLRHGISFAICNVEADPLPFESAEAELAA